MSIESLCATVIMVAHRLLTIKKRDRIIVPENGGIVGEGNYSQLTERHGLFEQLVLSQESERPACSA